MSQGVYEAALKNTLTEIKGICPGVINSFIFTKDGTIIAKDAELIEPNMRKIMELLESINERAESIGGLNTLQINGDGGGVQFSIINDMYLAMITSENVDVVYLRSATHVIIPTIMKLLQNIMPTPLTGGRHFTFPLFSLPWRFERWLFQ
jgi:predicted regulator of Ras-like GTPase activity (Roadblock/LC7/MglB family)